MTKFGQLRTLTYLNHVLAKYFVSFWKLTHSRNEFQRSDCINPFGHRSHPLEYLKLAEKMLLQELMHMVVIVMVSSAQLKILDPGVHLTSGGKLDYSQCR